MTYWQLFYHLVWTTHERRPLLHADLAQSVHTELRERATRMGATVYAVGGTENHVHLVAAVPPRWSIALFVGQLKSQVTRYVRRRHSTGGSFAWNESYGALSFSRRRLSSVIAYVEKQEGLHANGHLIRALELVEGMTPDVLLPAHRHFYIASEEWRRELEALDAELFQLPDDME